MGVDAFALRIEDVNLVGEDFLGLFLASPDFDLESLRAISRDLGLPISKKKTELATQIALYATASRDAYSTILNHLIITRKKGWASIKLGEIRRLPACNEPRELLQGIGEEQWYGPIHIRNNAETSWYIHSLIFRHWNIDDSQEDEAPREFRIRWLCFARIEGNSLSLHWRGFSLTESSADTGSRNTQFRYWEHVPELFSEIETFTQANVHYPQLHRIILHNMWDDFRHNQDYKWTDRRIRAEASGVTFNARAGAIYQIEAGGIRSLANTIRRAVEEELRLNHNITLPEGDWFDEVILRTLIREYGTLSYEFSLEQENELLFQSHTYFGQRRGLHLPDKFPHMNLHITKRDDLEQIAFLIDYLRNNENRQPEQRLLL